MTTIGLRGLIAAAALVLLTACGGGQENAPADFVRGVYAPYIANKTDGAGLQARGNFTADLNTLLDKVDVYSRLLDEPIIDFDPIINAQDWVITSVDATVTSPPKDGAATVDARFDNDGPRTVTFDLRQEGGAWKIDNIRTTDSNLRNIIAENLKPAGDTAAMEAPVRAIYTRYASGPPPEPLHRWAALSAGLRPLLAMQSSVGRRADTRVLDFDPIVDGQDRELGPVAYEAASSAVIARFQNVGEPKIVVYDLVQEDGAWKIANIRAPGAWDLLQKLTAAGIKE